MQGRIWQGACRCHTRSISRAPLRAQYRAYTSLHDGDDNPMFTRSELPKPKLDYASIIQHLDTRISNALARNAPIDVSAVSTLPTLYSQYKDYLRSISSIRAEQNTLGIEIQQAAKAKDNQKRDDLLGHAKSLKSSLLEKEKTLNGLEHRLLSLCLTFPNDTHPQSPLGPESNANPISSHGPTPLPPSPSRNHLSISKKFDLLNFESGGIVTGRSWYYLLNEAAILETALVNYAMSVAVQAGFVPVITPDVVRTDIAARCGFTPREPGGAASQMYHITNHLTPSQFQSRPELVLSGTAEIPLAGLFANNIYPSDQLPLKHVGVGRSFRSEAGASAESRGLYRVHQFTKVELFAVTPKDQSEGMMEHIKNIQKTILEGLGLSFRILDMPSQELGASAFRKYDMEVWMPGHQTWGEVSSLSNCTDYQSRRLLIRYRPLTPKGTISQTDKSSSGALPFAHTLNGTAAAIPRLIIALLENGAVLNENGDVEYIRLPKTLKPFWIETGRNIIQWEGDKITP